MTPENAKTLLPIITAYAEGKVIQQINSHGNWVDLVSPTFAHSASTYRIKPEPKQVLMTMNDLSSVFWVREKESPESILITCIFDDGTLCWGVGNHIKPESFYHYEWSTGRKTWNSFVKEVLE